MVSGVSGRNSQDRQGQKQKGFHLCLVKIQKQLVSSEDQIIKKVKFDVINNVNNAPNEVKGYVNLLIKIISNRTPHSNPDQILVDLCKMKTLFTLFIVGLFALYIQAQQVI